MSRSASCSLLALALLAACGGKPTDSGVAPTDTDTDTDTDADADTDADTDTDTDADTDTDTDTDPAWTWDWTPGPEVPACTPAAGDGDLVALSGVVLAPEGAEAGLVVYSRSTGLLTCVGPDCDTTGADVVCTEGVISPGLVDAHNHLQYNIIPPWQHEGQLFDDRYDWQSDGGYWDYREAYDALDGPYTCEIMKWAELRVLVGGGTAAVGSSGGDCIRVLVRNLDEDTEEHGLDDYYMTYSSGRAEYYESWDGEDYQDDLASGYWSAVMDHVGEGLEQSVGWELDHMSEVGMAGDGFAWVHSTAATTAQLARMAEDGTALVWSPRSNLDLYAMTTDADVAHRLGVPVALGPDWTWSGSMNPAHEGQCALEYLTTRQTSISDVDLWSMMTADAARAAGAEAWLGQLIPGLAADIAVFDWAAQPYRAVIDRDDAAVRLVVVGGEALYGNTAMVTSLARYPEWCETVEPCGTTRTVCLQRAETGDDAQRYAEVELALETALAAETMPADLAYAGTLHGLFVCDETPRASCDLSAPTAGDVDGDGVADGSDLCPTVYDPLQRDNDLDAVGDACDPCPLRADSTDCPHDPANIDGDGIPTASDTCPYVYDPDQVDADSDGHGDACDACPADPNPGDAPCPAGVTTIMAVRNPAHPDHPAEGSAVTIEDVVVTASSDNGFHIQDPSALEWAGIFVFDGGSAPVAIGDVVTVTGTYAEFYDQSEIDDSVTVVSGSAPVPAPIAVADACDIGTGGADAERYESMLLIAGPLEVSNSNPDSPDDYGEFEVNGCLRVDDAIYDGLVSGPAIGTSWSAITGVLTYTYSDTKLAPRSAADLVE